MEDKQYATKQPMGHWKKSKRKFKKYLEASENRNTMIQNLWGAAKSALRGNFIAIPKGTRKIRTNKTQS